MTAVSFSIHNGLLCQTSMSHLIPLEYWVMEQCYTITGSQAHGFQYRSPNQSSIKNCSLLWLQRTFKAHSACPRESFLSDNSSVLEILWSGTWRALTIISLVCYLCLLAACHSSCFTASSVSAKCNLKQRVMNGIWKMDTETNKLLFIGR